MADALQTYDIDGSARNLFFDTLRLLIVGLINALDDLLGLQGFQLGRGRAHNGDQVRPGVGEFRGQRESNSTVGARHSDALAFEKGRIVDGRNVQIPLVVFFLGAGEARRLIRNGVLAVLGHAQRSGTGERRGCGDKCQRNGQPEKGRGKAQEGHNRLCKIRLLCAKRQRSRNDGSWCLSGLYTPVSVLFLRIQRTQAIFTSRHIRPRLIHSR